MVYNIRNAGFNDDLTAWGRIGVLASIFVNLVCIAY